MVLKPSKYEPLFTSAADVHNNACVNWCHNPLELYATAYKEAADKLVEQVINSARHQDTLVYPIVFLYRQYIELRLKEIIREGRKLLLEPGNFPQHHCIDKLWSIAKTIIEKVFEGKERNLDFGFVEHVLSELSSYDAGSFSFRYPTDKKGNNPLADLTYINIRHLAETINHLAAVLEEASTGISVYRDCQNDMSSSI